MSSAPTRILDSHVHLWPQSAANASGHGWMKPGAYLTRQYGIVDYLESNGGEPSGFVYVETDRFLPQVTHASASEDDLRSYVKEPLKEIAFLRRIAEGKPQPGEGHESQHCGLMKGAVAWAPLQLGPTTLKWYLQEAETVAGPKTWKLIKGFRFLLQGIKDQEVFEKLVLGEDFLGSLQELGSRRFTFDVGVDQKRGGVRQLEVTGEMIKRVREKGNRTVFILNHMCKPDFEGQRQTEQEKKDFERWTTALEFVSRYPGTYMKLSGGFSELGKQDPEDPWPADFIITRMKPWIDVIFKVFAPERIMFGSDWPVCCVSGPGDKHSWKSWRNVVDQIVKTYNLTDEHIDRIWYGTAVEAYGLDV